MSTVICQGLEPCLDSQLIEKTMLRLKIVQPKSPTPVFPLLGYTHNAPKKVFLDEQLDFSKPFFPSLRLSDKSLELCTENLGSESGSDTSEGFDFNIEKMFCENAERNFSFRPLREMKKGNPPQFPPPLTTISGSNSLQVRPHREAGRLVMKAIHAPTFGSYFHAERSHGRLRLSIFKNQLTPESHEDGNMENVFNVEIQENHEEDQENHEEDQENQEKHEEDQENQENHEVDQENHEEDQESDIYEEGDEDEEDIYDAGDEENDIYEEGDEEEKVYEEENVREEWNANKKDTGVEMGIENYRRSSRCKEEGGHGDKGWRCWEGTWVATS